MDAIRTLRNALVGAVASILLSALPLSTLLGGLVAGFLEGPDGRGGAVVGALAGLIAFLPFLGIAGLVFAVLGLGASLGFPVEGAVFLGAVFAAIAAVTFVYTVVLALLGGYLGAHFAREYPGRRADALDAIGMDRSRRSDRYETN